MMQNIWHQMPSDAAPSRDRWLLSYADLLTLLLAFFVVMYSVSAVNETKLAELASSLSDSFNQAQQQNNLQDTQLQDIQEIIDSQALVASLGIDGEISEGLGQDVTISLPGEILFDSATSELKPGAAEALDKLLPILQSAGGSIEVIGHTDNLPVSSPLYPSNWELSAHRAASAVRYLEHMGIARTHLVAIGRADVEPIARNDSKEGRASNRRVVFRASKVDWSLLQAEQSRATESPSETDDEALPDIESIDPALLEQVLRDLDSGGG
jgi:chemotaxis protein MotB